MVEMHMIGYEVLPSRRGQLAVPNYSRRHELKDWIVLAAKVFLLAFHRLFAATVFLAGAALSQLMPAQAATVSFIGDTTGDRITFRISLPPTYVTQERSYPVIYHLHGKGGDYNSGMNIDESLRLLMVQGRIPEAILVFPDGDDDSFWADSFDGQRRIEDEVIQDVIGYVDTNYRTFPDRAHRIVSGFSMGGFGAMDYAMKYPGRFRAAIAFDGALLTWERMLELERNVAASMFNNDEEYFDHYSPYANATKNRVFVIQNDVKLLMIVGAITSDNKNWSDHLDSLGISYEKRFTNCEHRLGCLLDADIADLSNFLAENLR